MNPVSRFFSGLTLRPHGITLVIAGLVFQQTGAGIAIPTLIAWAQTKFPFEHRGRGMGVWTSAFFFGQFVMHCDLAALQRQIADHRGLPAPSWQSVRCRVNRQR